MTSTIKVNNIQNQCGTDIVKRCGATTTVGSGAGNTVVVCGSTVTIGRCGGTVALASGATQSGFGREGSVNWQTGSIKTSTFTAASGEGYFCNTSGGAFTVNLPAGSAGAIVAVSDYTRTFQTNNLTVSPNGSEKIGGQQGDAILSTEGQSATFVYVDGTEGWINVQETSNSVAGQTFITATGGTITTCGNFKIHTFTGPGTFCVSQIASTAAENTVGYLVVAGGGGASTTNASGGGGAGGFREGRNVPVDNFTASPLVANAPTNAVTITATSFPITVGGGGANGCIGANGSNSIFSSITSAGGGGAGGSCTPQGVGNGGSGGGGGGGSGSATPAGSGNTPPVSPPQGNNGGVGVVSSPFRGSGGGGALSTGGTGSTGAGGNGGTGAGTSIPGSPITRSGGGAGNGQQSGGTGGAGGGGNGFHPGGSGSAGSANTGGGGGGRSGSGGSGIVVIRYKFQ